MMVVGITGPTGAGKSIVCRLLGEWERISVIDCDQVSRQVVRRGGGSWGAGGGVSPPPLGKRGGKQTRRKLASIVFADRRKLRRMESIIYPYILASILHTLAKREKAGDRAVFLDAPTLYQSGADILCQRVVAVLAPPEDRLRRIMERDGLTADEAKARMACQPGDDFFEKRVNYVIRNTGRMPGLRLDVLELQNKLGL